MPSNVAIHGTNVKAGAAADAVQHLAFFRMSQKTAAAVIDQNHVKLIRTVSFIGTSRSPD